MTLMTKLSLRAMRRAFSRDTSGIAAVEFGLLAPVLMVMLFGALEVSRAVLLHKRFQRATAMVGDLIAREQRIGDTVNQANATLNGIMKSAKHVMQPHDTSTLKIKVFSVRAAPSNATQTKAEWQYDMSTQSSSSTCANKAMPASGMITAGNTAILVESQYYYQPIMANLAPGGFDLSVTWSDTITHSPRKASCVEWAGNLCGALCP